MKHTIFQGDSIEVSTFGCTFKGFVLSHFLVSKTIGSDETEVLSWFLIDQRNKIVMFNTIDTFNTTRIVLTEKIKLPTQLNEEFHDKLMESKREFEQRRFMFKSRSIGKNFLFHQSVIFNLGKKEEMSEIGMPNKKIHLIAGKSK